MDSSVEIDLNKVKQIILRIIKDNKSTTINLIMDTLKSYYPNVNNVHLHYNLHKVMCKLKNDNIVQEIENRRLDFGPNVHQWTENIYLIDLSIIQHLKLLHQLLSETQDKV